MGQTVQTGAAVSLFQETPVAPAMKKGKASAMHKKAGFARYSGPRLVGHRMVLDAKSEDYPELLLNARNPPERLYVVGNPTALKLPGLAVIGARKASPYGLGCVSKFGKIAASQGICLVSGGARGCDSQAHRTALASHAPTVAVLGGGCDQLYPREHYRLFQDIVDGGGAVISENEWDFPPMRHTFRERNRIIAGLSRALLIVEAGYPSGTFSTADEALLASRDVMVVPGSIMSSTSLGSNHLIRQGALPIVDSESFQDALFDCFGVMKADGLVEAAPLQEESDPLLEAIFAMPSTREELIAVAVDLCKGSDVASWLSSRLTEFEIKGLICRYPNGRYGPVVK